MLESYINKKSIFKKVLCLTITAVITITTVLGCGKPKTQNSNASKSNKVYTYRMVMNNFGPWDKNPEMVQYWEKHFKNVKFDLVYVENSNAADKINLMISSGDIPDVLQYIDQQKYYEQGIIGGWDEQFFRKNAPNIAKYIDDTDPTAWNIAKFDGKLMYSIPGFRLYNTIPNPVWWRTDWLKKLGINEIPQKLEDVEAAFYKIAKGDPNGNGKKVYALSNTGLDSIYGAFGTMRGMWLLGDDGKVVLGDITPGAKEAVTLLRKWYKDGVLDPEFITGENQGGYWAISHSFLNDRIGYSGIGSFYHWVNTTNESGGTYLGSGEAGSWKKAGKVGTYAPGYPPIGPDGKRGTKQGDFRTLRTAFSKKLVKDTDRFARLLQVIDELNCKDTETSLSVERGLYGKYSTITKDFRGIPTYKSLTGETDLPKLSAIGAANTFSFIEEGGNLDYQKVVYGQEYAWAQENLKDKSFGYKSAIFGALPSQTKYSAELGKILDSGFTSIITGDKPIDYFDEMVANWKKAGGDQLTKEANELYLKQSKK
ncbi:MAG: extracellular solute-binding protein [Clostridiales bacterium]|nr:extracellular solute-binding protein [Clostridiales bacterium]